MLSIINSINLINKYVFIIKCKNVEYIEYYISIFNKYYSKIDYVLEIYFVNNEFKNNGSNFEKNVNFIDTENNLIDYISSKYNNYDLIYYFKNYNFYTFDIYIKTYYIFLYKINYF